MSSKACLYNLLVVSRTEGQLEKLASTFTQLFSRLPGRLVTLFHQKEGAKKIEKKELPPTPLVGSSVQTQPGIALTVSGFEEEKVALTPLPYLIPDLPVLLFWLPENTEDPLFKNFYAIADRLLIDGDEASNLKDHLIHLNHFVKEKLPVVDLAWTRGEGWRNVFRDVFSGETRKKGLERCNLIQISYVDGCTLTPRFFQAWLKTVLKGKIEFQLIPQQTKYLPPGAILNIECTSLENDQFLIYRSEESLEVTAHICTQETCDLPTTLYLPNMKRAGSYFSSWIFGPTQQEMVKTLALL